jgi:hypothetical protein
MFTRLVSTTCHRQLPPSQPKTMLVLDAETMNNDARTLAVWQESNAWNLEDVESLAQGSKWVSDARVRMIEI